MGARLAYSRRVRLGIDFGTTRTVVARVDRGRHPIVSFDTGGGSAEWIPGACAELADGARVHGWEAIAAHDAPALIRSVKRC